MTDRDLNQSTPATENEVIVGDNQILNQENKMLENQNIQETATETIENEIGESNSNNTQESQMTAESKTSDNLDLDSVNGKLDTISANYMSGKKMVKMAISDIRIPQNHRKMDSTTVDSLAKSIKDSGLIYSPIISLDNCVIVGQHRIAALLKAGITEVEFIQLQFKYDSDECRLITLTENVERKELSRMEKALAIVEMQQLLKKLRPVIKPTTKMSREKQIAISDKTIAKQVMAQLKIQKSEYYELLGIVKSIAPEVRDYLATLNMNDNFKVAIDIADLTKGQQLDLIKLNPSKAEFEKDLKEMTARNSKELNQKTDKITATKQEKVDQQEAEIDELLKRLKEISIPLQYAELDKTFELRLSNNFLLQEFDNRVQLIWFLKGMLRITENKKMA